MAGMSGIGNGTRAVAGGIFAIAFALVVYFVVQNVNSDDELVSAPVGDAVSPETVATEATSEPTQTAEAAPTPEPAAEPQAPSFDVVRVEPDGSSVIAGTAHPGADVAIILDGAEVGQATADNQGKFVALLSVPTSDGAQVLSLSTKQTGGEDVTSNESVILAPAAPSPAPQTTDAGPQVAPLEDIAALQVPEQDMAPSTGSTDTPVAVAPVVPSQAPAVLLATDEGVRVLQPAESGPSVMRNVVIDAISYDAGGEVQLAGRGTETGFVRVYLDNKPILTTRIEDNGEWRTQLPNVDTGIYTLRVDQVDADGTVTSRTETPFKRETVTVLESVQTATTAQQVSAITVQPGSTLWAIARESYGDGTLYVRVFEANRDHIRNPDLIYPGQVFTVPE